MERDAYVAMAQIEDAHWWYRARREFIEAAFASLRLPRNATILDAGCGTGGSLSMLSRFGTVLGVEYDADARDIAAQRGIAPVLQGSLPHHLPRPDTRFDAIGLFDVLEHLEQPVESLATLRGRLVSNGAIVLTVPAYQWLWGPHDDTHRHFRRYTAGSLREHLEQAGMRVEYLSYFNSVLLPLAILQRLRERVMGYSFADLVPAPRVNELLFRIWRSERLWIPSRRAPFGLSILAIARSR